MHRPKTHTGVLHAALAGFFLLASRGNGAAAQRSATQPDSPPPAQVAPRECEQLGEASWYGPGFHGEETASGKTFDQNELTAAHKTLPLGTEAEVTDLETGESVEVEINDRGPYVDNRVIDLSRAAAEELGMKKEGTAPVKIEAEVEPQAKKPVKCPPSTTPDQSAR